MRKPLRVISLRRRKSRLGGSPGKVLPANQALSFQDKRIHAIRRRLTVYLCLLILVAALVLYLAGYLPVMKRGFEQSRLVRAVKLFIASKFDSEQDEAVKFVQWALEQRTALLLAGDAEDIIDNYDLDSSPGTWAYENEVNRIAYLRKWVQARNVRMVEAVSTFEVDSVIREDDGYYWIELTEHTVYAYEYPHSDLIEPTWALEASLRPGTVGAFPLRSEVRISSWPRSPDIIDGAPGLLSSVLSVSVSDPALGTDEPSVRHEFGSRTVHVIEVIKAGSRWKIRKDWYQDPLGNNVAEPGQASDAAGSFPGDYSGSSETGDGASIVAGSTAVNALSGGDNYAISAAAGGVFDREKALRYAVKHSGVRALPEGGKYNPKYKIYTFAGGDCANFASQVLHAGGLPMGGGWHYAKEGSTAWVQSESLVWHLLSSSKGIRLFRGTFSEAGSGVQSDSPAGELEPGDIIAYEIKGQLCHVAVVAGKDPRGYVTIASHTADRLYFPWDLGWDDSTVFWFIKITY